MKAASGLFRSAGDRRDRLDRHRDDPGAFHVELVGRARGNVDQQPRADRAAIVDRDDDRSSIIKIGYPHPGIERQRTVGGGWANAIESLAARGPPAEVIIAIPGGGRPPAMAQCSGRLVRSRRSREPEERQTARSSRRRVGCRPAAAWSRGLSRALPLWRAWPPWRLARMGGRPNGPAWPASRPRWRRWREIRQGFVAFSSARVSMSVCNIAQRGGPTVRAVSESTEGLLRWASSRVLGVPGSDEEGNANQL